MHFRYAVLTKETWPLGKWKRSAQEGVEHILQFSKVKPDEYQMGKNKIFIKAPESVSQKCGLK